VAGGGNLRKERRLQFGALSHLPDTPAGPVAAQTAIAPTNDATDNLSNPLQAIKIDLVATLGGALACRQFMQSFGH